MYSLTREKNTSPVLIEALLILKVNRSLWDAHSVGIAMGQTRDQELLDSSSRSGGNNEGNEPDDPDSTFGAGGDYDDVYFL